MLENLSFARRISFYILGIVFFVLTLGGLLYLGQEYLLWKLQKNVNFYEEAYQSVERIRAEHLRWKVNFLSSLLNEDLAGITQDKSVELMQGLKDTPANFKEILEAGEKMNALVSKMRGAKNFEEALSYYNEFQKYSKYFLWEGLEGLIKHYHQKILALREEFKKTKLILQIIYFLTLLPLSIIIFFALRAIENTLKGSLTQVEEYSERVSQGDLTEEVEIKTQDEFGRIFGCLNKITQTLKGLLGQLLNEVKKVQNFTQEFQVFQREVLEKTESTSQRSQHLLEQASLISLTIEDSATSTSEITKAIDEISKNTHLSSQISKEAVHKAEATKKVMHELNQVVDEISEVINLINGIAEQTKFLALNASIEAARAGEAGKGFAVVAGEVKDLAKRVTEATLEVTEKIQKIQLETKKAVKETEEVVEIINRINEVATSIAGAVEEQSIAIRNIAEQIEQTKATASFMAEDAKHNFEAAEEIRRLLELQSSQLQNLTELVKTVTALVERFKL